MHSQKGFCYCFMEKNIKEKESEKVTVSRPADRLKKKRLVVSYANMSPELANAFKEKYPRGYADYMGSIFKVEKPDGSFFYAVSIEIPEAVYLVKIDVKIDDYEDVENGFFGDNAAEGDEAAERGTFPDDDTAASSFGADEESDE